MFKRLAAMCAILSAFAIAIAAQEAVQETGPVLSGSVSAGFVENNLFGNPFVEDIPGLSGELGDATVELRLSSLAFLSAIDRSLYKGVESEERRMGFEAGLSLDLADLLDLGSASSEDDFNADTSGYPFIQRMLDWYVNNRARYGLPAQTWPTTSYGMSSGRYRFIYGNTAEPIEWVVWTQEKWSDARSLYTDLEDIINAAIEAVSPDVTSGSHETINQYDYLSLTPQAQRLVLLEQEAAASFQDHVYGSDSSLAQNGVKIRNAWLTLTDVFGVMNARFDFKGPLLSVGSLVRSPRTAQEESGPLLALSMAPGLIPGLSVSLSTAITGGTPSVAEDWNTKSMELFPGHPAWVGAKLSAAYDFYALTGQDLRVSLDALAPDLAVRPDSFALSASARYALAGILSVDVAAEFNALLWNDRYVEGDASVFAMAAALDASAAWNGLGGSIRAAYKTAGFGGWGGNDADDLFPAADLWSDFDAAKLGTAVAVQAGVKLDPSAILGRRLLVLEGGFGMLLYGQAALAVQGSGWFADAALDFQDLIGAPLSVDLTVSSWTNHGLVLYDDSVNWPVPGLLADLTLDLAVRWAPSEHFELSLVARDSDSGYKRDTYRVTSVGVYATVSF